jgi:hypothetical protein
MNVLGIVTNYQDLHAIMRARAEELEISRENLDDWLGVQSGYSSKLLAPSPSKKLGASTFAIMLPGLAIKLLAVEDDEMLARIKANSKIGKRSAKNAKHAGTVSWTVSKRHIRAIQRKGGENSRRHLPRATVRGLARKAGKAGGPNSRKYMSHDRASELARHANAVRWAAVKSRSPR